MTLETWSASVGERGFTVWVGELTHKGMAVYLRWGKPNQYQRTEVGTVRDERGRVLKRKVGEALAEAQSKVEELKGLRPSRKRSGPMTLGDGVARAFSLEGCYPKDPTTDSYTRETLKRVEYAVRLLGGPETLWEEVTPGMIRGIWRKVQRAFPTGGGYNKAQKTVGHFLTIASWLSGEFPDQRFPRAPHRWQGEMRAYWTSLGLSIEPARPRYTAEETAALFAHRDEADPRLLLALMLGAELRGGQVVRTLRASCTLEGETWVVPIPYRSTKKKAPVLLLNALERAVMRHTLTDGYLAGLEALYRAGEVKDYALFPEGKLKQGRATVKDCEQPMEASTLRGLLKDLERAAKVDNVKGRGWHGLRRAFSDYYATLAVDGRLLDETQGWVRGSTMRERVYQDQEDVQLQKDASALRLRRPGMPGSEGQSSTRSSTKLPASDDSGRTSDSN